MEYSWDTDNETIALDNTRHLINLSVVETDEAFDSLEHAWSQLAERSDCSIFQTFEWQRTWWKYFGKGKKLHHLVFERDGRIIGIAPMLREQLGIFGIKIISVLKFSGSDLSDYIDVIAEPDDRPEILKHLVEYLRSVDQAWDFFEMRDVSERCPTRELLPQYFEDSGFTAFTYQGNVCPQVQLPPTWQEFLQHIGGNLRYQLKKKSDRLSKAFPVEIEVVTDGDDAVENAVRDFAAIHGARWEGLGYLNAFKDPHFLAFHVEVSQKFARRGWLRMFFLNVSGSRVAVNFDFNFRHRIYFYQGNVHGSEELMKYSPGFLLRCAAIEAGIAEGMETYDMLRGDDAYKANDFKCIPVGNWQIRAVPPQKSRRIKFKIFINYELLKRTLKRLHREYRDIRRFSRTKKPSALVLMSFVGQRLAEIGKHSRYRLARFSWRGKDKSA